MTRRQIEADRARTTSGLRCNLFRHKGQPDLCCAVPEDRPVPSFVTGERWDFRGTWEDAISPPGLYLTAAELHVCLNSFHIFRIARQLESRRMFEDPKRHEVCGEPA
jgi:hypothetical protein